MSGEVEVSLNELEKGLYEKNEGDQWTDDEIKLLQGIVRKCEYKRSKHDDAEGKNRSSNKYMSMALVLFASFSALGGVTGVTSLDTTDPQYGLYVFLTVSGVLLAILSGWNNVFNYGGKAESHRASKVSYGALVRDIKVQLASGCDRRVDCEKFLIGVTNAQNEIENTALGIPPMLHEQ